MPSGLPGATAPLERDGRVTLMVMRAQLARDDATTGAPPVPERRLRPR
jgi:hypothetical protein